MPSLNSKSSPRSLLKKRQAKVRKRRHQMQFFYLKERRYIPPGQTSALEPIIGQMVG